MGLERGVILLARETCAQSSPGDRRLIANILRAEELAKARDLWFDLARRTNEFDSSSSHGVLLLCRAPNDAQVSTSAARRSRDERASAAPEAERWGER